MATVTSTGKSPGCLTTINHQALRYGKCTDTQTHRARNKSFGMVRAAFTGNLFGWYAPGGRVPQFITSLCDAMRPVHGHTHTPCNNIKSCGMIRGLSTAWYLVLWHTTYREFDETMAVAWSWGVAGTHLLVRDPLAPQLSLKALRTIGCSYSSRYQASDGPWARPRFLVRPQPRPAQRLPQQPLCPLPVHGRSPYGS